MAGKKSSVTEVRVWPVNDEDAPSVRAVAQATIGPVTVRHLKLKHGVNGLFVEWPSKKGRSGNYTAVVLVGPALAAEVERRIIAALAERAAGKGG